MKKIKITASLVLCICIFLSCFQSAFAVYKGSLVVTEESTITYLPGDIDNNGTVSAQDARMILRFAVGLETWETIAKACACAAYYNYRAAADTTGDGKITAEDARLVLRAAVGLDEIPAIIQHLVSFETNGGSEMESCSVVHNTPISELSKPFYAGYIFNGWFYDSELTQAAVATDTITQSLTLYASYVPAEELQIAETPSFTSAIYATPDFSITILSSEPAMTAEDVMQGVVVENISVPSQEDFYVIEGENGSYTLHGKDEFEKGMTYTVTLADERLTFLEQPETVRDFNFFIEQENVLDIPLSDAIVYIPFDDITDIIRNGKSTDTLSIALLTVDENGETVLPEDTEGSFTYNGDEDLQPGMTIVVYDGMRPDLRNLDTPTEQCGDVAYLQITSIDGSRIAFSNAATKNIFVKPDILPVEAKNDLDEDETTVTLANKHLDFSEDIYAQLNLDSNTVVEEGDYIVLLDGMFMTSDMAVISYALITAVEKGEETTVLHISPCEEEELKNAFQLHAEQSVLNDEYFENADLKKLEEDILQKAIDTGFAEEASMQLASGFVADDGTFMVPENFTWDNISFVDDNGAKLSMPSVTIPTGKYVTKIKVQVPKVHISRNLKQLDESDGLRIAIELSVKITIGEPGLEDHFNVVISATLEEEIHLKLSIDGYPEFISFFGLFPIFYDYRVAISIDRYEYTGFAFEAEFYTSEDQPKDNWTSSKKINAFAKGIKAIKKFVENSEKGDQINIADGIAETYQKLMSKETDWVTLFEHPMMSETLILVPALPIASISIDLAFVVGLNVNATFGIDMYHVTRIRNTYSIGLLTKTIKSSTIPLDDEISEVSAYAMGMIGIRLGIKCTAQICFISDKVAAVSLSLEGGLSFKLYGYVYYSNKRQGDKSEDYYSGAFLFDINFYIESNFDVDLMNGLFYEDWDIIKEEYPIFSVGEVINELDFSIPQEDLPLLKFRPSMESYILPDDVFTMRCQNMRTGEILNKYYDDSQTIDNPNFTITVSDDKFKYDTATNMISVQPAEDDLELKATLTIKWKKSPYIFTSLPMTRTIDLHWTKLRDGYLINCFTNGGSYTPSINEPYGTAVSQPEDPTRTGYVFTGWYEDEECTIPYTFPKTMPNYDTNIYAGWKPADDTPYTIEYYMQALGTSTYDLYGTQYMTGTTDSVVNPEPIVIEGFVKPSTEPAVISWDGSTVIRYYYDRIISTLTFDPGEAPGEADTYLLQYGAAIYAPEPQIDGYEFLGWDKDVAEVMGAEDVTYTAQWRKLETEFRIEYYVQDTEGRYVLQEQIYDKALPESVITEDELLNKRILSNGKTAAETFIQEGVTAFSCITVNGNNLTAAGEDAVVSPDVIIKVRFARSVYNVAFDPANGQETIHSALYSGATITAPTVTKTGYTFVSWDNEVPATIGTQELSFKAIWEANDYTVYFDNNGGEGTMSAQGMRYDIPGTLVENTFTKNGYTFAGWSLFPDAAVAYTDKEAINNLIPQGSLTLYAAWTPVTYSILYMDAEEHNNPGEYTIETNTVLLHAPASRKGWTFVGWTDADGNPITQITKGSTGNLTLYAQWKRNTATVQFHANGGEGIMEDQSFTYGIASTLQSNRFNRRGYTFVGWSLLIDGDIVYTDQQCISDLTDEENAVINLYAQWQLNTYTIQYQFNGGCEPDEANAAQYTVNDTVVLHAPLREGYTFAGWFTNEAMTGDAVSVINAGNTGNLMLFAKWIANTNTAYTVRYFLENTEDDQFTLYESHTDYGTTDTEITPARRHFEGFAAPAAQTVIITGDGRTTVDYYYTRNIHSVIFIYNDKKTTDSVISGKYGAPIVLPTPTREGYGFDGWFTASDFTGERYTTNSIPDSTFTLYAKWVAGEYGYTVNHYTENTDGSWYLEDTEQFTGTMDMQVTPAVKQYAGFTAPAAQTITISTSNASVNYYYSRNQHKLTWILNGGEVNGDHSEGFIAYGAAITAPTVTRTGYTGKWDHMPVSIMPDEDLIYTMLWTANTYTVTLDAAGGICDMQTISVTYDSAYGKLPTARREHYIFNGWFNTNGKEITDNTTVKITQNTTLLARWTPITYKLTYLGMDGVAYSYPTTYTTESSVSIADPVRKGYTFLGWTYEGQSIPVRNFAIPVGKGGNITLTANWKVNSYTFKFNTVGGNEIADITLNYGEAVKKPADPVKKGYTFVKWNQTIPVTMPDTNITFTAIWSEPIEYTITFNGIGADSVTNPITYTVESETIILPQPAKRPGYTFAGWFDNDAYTGTAYTAIPKGSTGHIILYAKWEQKQYSIYYDANNESGFVTEVPSYTYDESVTLLKNTFTKRGYNFAGWSTIRNGDVVYTDCQVVTQLFTEDIPDVFLYAVWEIEEYEILYANMQGVAIPENNPTGYNVENCEIKLLAPATAPTGYTFGGWYADKDFTTLVSDGTENAAAYTITTTGTRIFYCKWNPITIHVVLNDNLKDDNLSTGLMFTYENGQKLPAISTLAWTNAGYSFAGWSTEQDGEVVYKDNEEIPDAVIAENQTLHLYAVWSRITYYITYKNYKTGLKPGYLIINNPSSYTIEDTDITLKGPGLNYPSFVADGYTFLGWYDEYGNKLTSINIDGKNLRHITLTAKWAHVGEFAVSVQSVTKNSVVGNDVTYKITRTAPEGTQLSTDAVRIYYRTVNGTAFGSVDVVTLASEQNSHFVHVGGENIYAEFKNGATQKTFVVKQESDYAGSKTFNGTSNMANSYTNGTNRYYMVELYKAVYADGTVDTLSHNFTRMLTQDNDHIINNDLYTTIYTTHDDSTLTINGGTFDGNPKKIFNIGAFSGLTLEQYEYAVDSGAQCAFYFTADVSEKNDGYQYIRLRTSNDPWKAIWWQLETKPGGKQTNWQEDILFPSDASWQRDVRVNSCNPEGLTIVDDADKLYIPIDPAETIAFDFRESGAGGNVWYIGDIVCYFNFIDSSAPQPLSIAPMAQSYYKTGEKIRVSIVYNEVIASSSNMALSFLSPNTFIVNDELLIPVSTWSYAGGVGTNILTFEGTVTEDFEITQTVYGQLATIPASNIKFASSLGRISDYLGNQGTLA